MSATLEVVTLDTNNVHAATTASTDIALVLTKATTAGNAVIVKAYGAEDGTRSPSAALKLAKAVADDISGAHKSKGGARANVLAVLDALKGLALDIQPLDAQLLVSLSRVRLDALAAAKRADTKAKSDARKAASAVMNDRNANKQSRIEAAELMTEIDAEASAVKSDRIWAALAKAVENARHAGFSAEQMSELLY